MSGGMGCREAVDCGLDEEEQEDAGENEQACCLALHAQEQSILKETQSDLFTTMLLVPNHHITLYPGAVVGRYSSVLAKERMSPDIQVAVYRESLQLVSL